MSSKFDYTHFTIIKVIRLFTAYIAIYISTNYMSQIYTEAVLINDEDPPKLVNFVIFFLMIDIILNAISMLIYVLAKEPLNIDTEEFIIAGFDYIMTIVCYGILLYFVATTMYNKKFFLYKDDGLRAIRALSSMMYMFSTIIYIMPFGMIIKDNPDILQTFNPPPVTPVVSSILRRT